MEPCARAWSRQRRARPVVFILVATLGLSQCTHHQRQASATLEIVNPSQAACDPPGDYLIPNAPPFNPFANALIRYAQGQDFARKVVANAGSAHFTVRATAGGLDIHTSSSKRQDANKTLTVVIGLLTEQSTAWQKGSPASCQTRLRTLGRSDA